ncbi:MAG: RNA-guided endonuclease TnpB family protein, partial [Bacteroidota bacterium]|nr:RNA-guided endonuclease TnpB family protein [Bacteroidota bacterium]
SSRFLWNKCLAMNLDRLEKRQPILRYNELAYWLTVWKRSEEYGFLKECPSQVLQQKLKDLERAFRDCFDKSQPLKRAPVFKKRGLNDGIRFPQGFKIVNRRIFLPKIGWIGFHKSCDITGTIKSITITNRGGQWYASIQVEQMIEIGKHASDSELGIDAGIKSFAAFSDGTKIEGVHSFRKHEERLAREQRKLARKKKGSNNWKKQKQEIAKLHHTIANVRQDFHHKLSTDISKNHAKVYVEGLQISNMSASAKGTFEDPGSRVKAKSGLNKSILDQGWYEFRRQLDYKLFWRGGILVEVNPRHTSQRCSCCGYTAKENRLSQALFRCQVCGYEENADVNAAKNILTVGQTGMACQANRSSDRQQNPFRARVSKPARTREEVLSMAS